MRRIDFHGLFGRHEGWHGVITKSLRFHNTFHVGRPSKFTSDQHARRINNAGSNLYLLHFITEDFLDSFAEFFILFLDFFVSLLFFLVLRQLEAFLGDTDEFMSVKFLQLLNSVFIDWIDQEQYFKSAFLERFKERRVLNGFLGLTSDKVDVLLAFFHVLNVFFEGNLVLARGSAVVSQ